MSGKGLDSYRREVTAHYKRKTRKGGVEARSFSADDERVIRAGNAADVHPVAMAGFLLICREDGRRMEFAVGAIRTTGTNAKVISRHGRSTKLTERT